MFVSSRFTTWPNEQSTLKTFVKSKTEIPQYRTFDVEIMKVVDKRKFFISTLNLKVVCRNLVVSVSD